MSFKINPLITVEALNKRSLDLRKIKQIHKKAAALVIQKTNREETVDYFLSLEHEENKALLIIGQQKNPLKKFMFNAAKGKDGFEKNKISIGQCFIEEVQGNNVLFIRPLKGNAKKTMMFKALKKEVLKQMPNIAMAQFLEEEVAPTQDAETVKALYESIQQKVKAIKATKDSTSVSALQQLLTLGEDFLIALGQMPSNIQDELVSQQQTVARNLVKWKELIKKQESKTVSAAEQSPEAVIAKMRTDFETISNLEQQLDLDRLIQELK